MRNHRTKSIDMRASTPPVDDPVGDVAPAAPRCPPLTLTTGASAGPFPETADASRGSPRAAASNSLKCGSSIFARGPDAVVVWGDASASAPPSSTFATERASSTRMRSSAAPPLPPPGDARLLSGVRTIGGKPARLPGIDAPTLCCAGYASGAWYTGPDHDVLRGSSRRSEPPLLPPTAECGGGLGWASCQRRGGRGAQCAVAVAAVHGQRSARRVPSAAERAHESSRRSWGAESGRDGRGSRDCFRCYSAR